MTPPENEVLAPFIALLCKIDSYAKADAIEYQVPYTGRMYTVEQIFDTDRFVGAIIRSLIEDEMEMRGFTWNAYKTDKYYCSFKVQSKTSEDTTSKTRAVALAAWSALGGVA